MENRLQFRHHTPIFETREEAIDYIKIQIRYAEEGLVGQDPTFGYSLFAEPTILRYKNPDDETNPHVILAIGADTNETPFHDKNRFCIIDIDNTEKEIATISDSLERAIRSLRITALTTDTIALNAEITPNGTKLSGDVRLANGYIFDDIRRPNSIMATENGLFMYVNMTYDEESDTIKFIVNGDVLDVKLSNSKLVSGFYDKKDESLHLVSNDGNEVVVDCEELIAEWGVEGDGSKTPVVLTKEEIGYNSDEDHHHVEPWQDVLRADVRIKDEQKITENGVTRYEKDENSTNILNRTADGRYLYVDGKASNIIYYDNGVKSNVKDTLDRLAKVGLSNDNDNIIQSKVDGFFASTTLDYIPNENALLFKASGQPDKRIQLNNVELFTDVYYDDTTEELVIKYKDNEGITKTERINLGQLLTDWEWMTLNEGHNVNIVKTRITNGNDKVSADVKIFDGDYNILVDRNHQLYVNGRAEAIRYNDQKTVKGILDDLLASASTLNGDIQGEITRATAAEDELRTIIGTGFTTDNHETVTYKFNELSANTTSELERLTAEDTAINEKLNSLSAKTDSEIERATASDDELRTIIGTGFTTDSHETVTYKFSELTNNLQSEIDRATAAEQQIASDLQSEIDRATATEQALDEKIDDEIERSTNKDAEHDAAIASAMSIANTSLKDISNIDHSIDVDKTEPLEPVIKVNLSEEIEDGRSNIIKLNSDGLYADVDLSYVKEANKLVFHTSGPDEDKEILLDSMSDIINIYYDSTTEEIVIQYKANGSEDRELRVPLRVVIDEWQASENTDGAIHLWKVKNTDHNVDILYAEAIINQTHEDNALVNDHGSLYVGAENIVQKSSSFQCLSGETMAIEDVLGVDGSCSDPIDYPGAAGTILENAETFAEADAILADAIESLSGAIGSIDVEINGGETDTATVSIGLVDDVKTVTVDVKVKEDDTNVLEVVEDEGLYLSNVWDCGEYSEDDSDDVDDEEYMNYNRMSNQTTNGQSVEPDNGGEVIEPEPEP